MNYSNELKKWRVSHGLSQKELAYLVGITRQSVSKWERGINCPDIENIIMLSQIYQIPIAELLGIRSNREE